MNEAGVRGDMRGDMRGGGARITAAEHRSALAGLLETTPAAVPGYLSAHSGLPGPRANLPLVDVFAAVAPAALVFQLAASPDEYLALCGTKGLGRLCLAPPTRTEALAALARAAADPRWRVREGAARALQLIGDHDPARLHELIEAWSREPDPWLARAVVAGISEPRLLRNPAAQALTVQVCARASTLLLAGWPPAADPARDREAHRVLRLALGYGWSVAIAANPTAGLAAFGALADRDEPDARWIVRSNLTKARLRTVLAERNLVGRFD